MVMEALRYEPTSFEMPSWGSDSCCNVCVSGAMEISVRLGLDGINFTYRCIKAAKAEPSV